MTPRRTDAELMLHNAGAERTEVRAARLRTDRGLPDPTCHGPSDWMFSVNATVRL